MWDVVGGLAIQLCKYSFGSSITPVVYRNDVWFGCAGELANCCPYPRWRVALDMHANEINDVGGILVGNQSAGDLGMCLIGQHRLGTLALETTPDAVHLQGRPSREMLLRRVTWLGN